MKKRLFIGLILAAGLMMAGCMRGPENAGNVQADSTPNYMPQGAAATVQPSAAAESPQGYDWTANAPQVEARIGQLSEVEEARVVVAGNTALVGVKFDRAYQGEMTERIRQMVAAEVMQADPQITTVAVTADDDDVEDIYEISERTLAGRDMDTLKDDINEIVRNATTLR